MGHPSIRFVAITAIVDPLVLAHPVCSVIQRLVVNGLASEAMMIVAGSKKFISASFNSEQELEEVVQANAEYIFGPDCLYLPKSVIRTFDGFGTIPDGFVVDLASRRWFIVEAELAAHSVWNHIAPQVAKQIIAASQPVSRRKLIESVVNQVKESSNLKEKFEELRIDEIDIRQILSEIFEKRPM